MHIIIVEENDSGRKLLYRTLKTEGYKVSLAESGAQAMTLLKAGRTNIVLMDIFDCMCSADSEPRLTLRQIGAAEQVLLVTSGACERRLVEFISPGNLCCATALELPITRQRNSGANRILQMCSALRQSRHLSRPDGDFNWQRFNLLMHLPTDAYLGCGLLR
jgi:CheY-like chemotaxis protein